MTSCPHFRRLVRGQLTRIADNRQRPHHKILALIGCAFLEVVYVPRTCPAIVLTTADGNADPRIRNANGDFQPPARKLA